MTNWRITLYFYPFDGSKRIMKTYDIIADNKEWAIEVAKDTFFSSKRSAGELHVHPHNKGRCYFE